VPSGDLTCDGTSDWRECFDRAEEFDEFDNALVVLGRAVLSSQSTLSYLLGSRFSTAGFLEEVRPDDKAASPAPRGEVGAEVSSTVVLDEVILAVLPAEYMETLVPDAKE
jgi:hypothetical protein